MTREKLSHFAFLFLLLAAASITFFTYAPIALYFQDSDLAALQLVAHSFIEGHWSVFHWQQPYGGTALTPLRLLWMWGASLITHQSPFTFSFSQSFNYFLLPALFSIVIYLYLRRICSQTAAFLVALLFAWGQPYWMTYVGCDFYYASLLIGLYFMSIRTKVSNVWRELSIGRFVWTSLLSGFALYTHRASIIFILPFFVPNGTLLGVLDKARAEKSSLLARSVFKVAGFFALFFAYLFVTGPHLGSIIGKNIKLHSDANIQISVLLIVAWLLWIHRLELRRIATHIPFIQRAAILVVGTAIGLLPEFMYYRFQTGHVSATTVVGGMATSDEIVRAFLFDLPRAIRELASGMDTFAPALLTRNLGFLFWFLSAAYLFKSYRKNHRLEPFILGLLLSVASFVILKTYTHAPTRYLFLILLFMIPAMGLWIDSKIRELRDTGKKLPGVVLLLIYGGLFFYQFEFSRASQSLAAKYDVPGKYERIIQAFQKTAVKIVLVEDYNITNLLTLVAERHPYFITNGRILGPFEAFDLAKSETRVGILIWGTDRKVNDRISILNRDCVLTAAIDLGEKPILSTELTGSGVPRPANAAQIPLRGWLGECKKVLSVTKTGA